MNFEMTEDQLAVQEVAREFAEKRLKPRAEEFDAEACFVLRGAHYAGGLLASSSGDGLHF